ncbi:MAG: histidine phosphatase family protein, partial [Alphaproteobacteria bacterium]|nr:histidine phosphatase family protein [Alphaproteobacteria bacterium]
MTLRLKDGIALYFARHGETEANREKRFSGRKDTPLTDKGREQARRVGDILKRELGACPPLAFVSSPLQRARTTMEIVRERLDMPPGGYTIDPRLAEIDLGLWDQLTDGEARALDPALFDARAADKWHVRVPGGENYAEVAVRATSWLESLAVDTFAVSHGALTRIL